MSKEVVTTDTSEKDTKQVAATGVSEAIGTILAKLCYPIADELGPYYSEMVSQWRRNNAQKMLQKSGEMYDAIGVVGSAHPRIAHNIVEHSSWTDDDLIHEMWSGLMVSSCSLEGDDEDNLMFVNTLNQLTGSQVRILNFSVVNCKKTVSKTGLIGCPHPLYVTYDDLVEISGVSDVPRLDREMDHLRALELIIGGFSHLSSSDADIAPHSLGIHMYVRCQGYVGSSVEYFGLDE